MSRKSRKRIHGNDRAYMMLSKDIRRRWLQYGENRLQAYRTAATQARAQFKCAHCKKYSFKLDVHVDHIEPVGTRPRCPEDFCSYIYRMFNADCQALCKKCHDKKTKKERQNG
jgi:hypothetical protein